MGIEKKRGGFRGKKSRGSWSEVQGLCSSNEALAPLIEQALGEAESSDSDR